ncbi:MAG: hypothetical protein ABI528_01360 [bacterium]
MSAILIKADSKINKEIYKLAKKLGGEVYSLKEKQFEDFALGILMDNLKTNQLVSREEIFKKLTKK